MEVMPSFRVRLFLSAFADFLDNLVKMATGYAAARFGIGDGGFLNPAYINKCRLAKLCIGVAVSVPRQLNDPLRIVGRSRRAYDCSEPAVTVWLFKRDCRPPFRAASPWKRSPDNSP